MTTDPIEFAQIVAKAARGKDLTAGARITWLTDLTKEYHQAVYELAEETGRERAYWENDGGR